MEFFNNHKKLFGAAAAFFIGLTIMVAIMPALSNQENNAPLPDAVPLSPAAVKGKAIYIANGCVACHTQQVRNVDMDKVWGKRPSIASDYADIHRTDFWRNTATLMGSERTGPDLTDIGNRQPSKDWNLTHLYNPRIVVKESVMPAYPWLFTIKKNPSKKDVIVNIPAEFQKGIDGKVVATQDALYLIAYLQSLKQTPLPTGQTPPNFLYKYEKKNADGGGSGGGAPELDGKALYVANCQACHQENGEGLPGAFPPLKGSSVVDGDDLQKYVSIIMNGYTGRESEGFGPMPAVGTTANFTENEVAAIINYERSSWGNKGKKVTTEEIKKIMDVVKQNVAQK